MVEPQEAPHLADLVDLETPDMLADLYTAPSAGQEDLDRPASALDTEDHQAVDWEAPA